MKRRKRRTPPREYICYDNRTDEILALGTKEECAERLGIQVASFLSQKSAFRKRIAKVPGYQKRNQFLEIYEFVGDELVI